MYTDILDWQRQPIYAVEVATHHLKANDLVALPTETVYGLAARLSDAAIAKIYKVKQRPKDNPLIVHINSLLMLHSVISELSSEADALMKAFWPGPLTLVLPCRSDLSTSVTCGLNTVAVRMPDNACFNTIIDALNEPVVAPSANLSGRPSPTRAEHVYTDLSGKIPCIVDAGPTLHGIESTVIDLSADIPRLLRPGAIDKASLQSVLGRVIDCDMNSGGIIRSPGMKYKHYAPVMATVVLIREEALFRELASDESNMCLAVDEQLVCNSILKLCRETLYAYFRQADSRGVENIYIYVDASLENDAALYNRLLKASAKHD